MVISALIVLALAAALIVKFVIDSKRSSSALTDRRDTAMANEAYKPKAHV